jgi:ectoine hydroxylase-related dioxygenase (phytanoyl-CoA dioxygenase family)
MSALFKNQVDEQFFQENGYVVFDLLETKEIETLWNAYTEAFATKRETIEFANQLPYYISIFDKEVSYKRTVDTLVQNFVDPKITSLLLDYEVFYSNFMIKFPGDGQIEAHQDFNFVDESRYTAFNLWCPLVDTNASNGGLYVIPGSHTVFRTQRGPTIPQALTQYNQLLKKYGRLVPLQQGQAILFDHKLVHFSPPNYSEKARVAIQSVVKPKESPALHYFFNQETHKVLAYTIDKEFIFENNLWDVHSQDLQLDHEQDLIPFPAEKEVIQQLTTLKVKTIESQKKQHQSRNIFSETKLQEEFETNGFVKLPLLTKTEISQLTDLFLSYTEGNIKNTDYGMYISLEENDSGLKQRLVSTISSIILPKVKPYFIGCKPHLGSFLVKGPGDYDYTYPHQDWTFVDSPPYHSMTVWIALVDTDESNGALGFVKGSHLFFDKPIGSPSPEFQTYTNGHEDFFYEYLTFQPLKAGEAIVFDNRTIHGAPPNKTESLRIAVAIGMTPEESQLYHYYLLPNQPQNGHRQIAKLNVDEGFFHSHSVHGLKQLFSMQKKPEGYSVEEIINDEFIPYSRAELLELCKQTGLEKNGRQLIPSPPNTTDSKFIGIRVLTKLIQQAGAHSIKQLLSRFRS